MRGEAVSLTVDLEHVPADYTEAVEMLRRVRQDVADGRILTTGCADCAEAVIDIFFDHLRNGRSALQAMEAALHTMEQGLRDVEETVDATESEKHLAFEWLRHTALQSKNARSALYAAIMMSEIARLKGQQPIKARYVAPLQLIGGKTADLQVRFVAREHIKDKPTEANPSPIRVLLVGDIEQAQPTAVAYLESSGG